MSTLPARSLPVLSAALPVENDPIFKPLGFRHLTVKNRVFRSSISGRFDNYDGSGTRARINWELKFARGGVGAICSAFVPVHAAGRILPNYARIDSDEMIPFWRELVREVHAHDCRYLIQLSHSGRQRDLPSIEYPGPALSSTNTPEGLHGLECRAMSQDEIHEVVGYFAAGARRAREAGADGIELHGANGYLFTQFLSSGINDRSDGYGGPIENRARFAREVVQAIRREVGRDFHVQYKISATDYNDALFPWLPAGNTVEDSIQVLRWLEEDGIDGVHVSTGSSFPHPRNPGGDFPVREAATNYEVMLKSGLNTKLNFWLFNHWPFADLFAWWWRHRGGPRNPEGANLDDAARIKQALRVPVITTGGFQTAAVVRDAITAGRTDAVSIARPLIANPDLVHTWRRGQPRPDRPCTYCNNCLSHVVMDPLGCYDPSRFDSHEQMMAEVLSVFRPSPYTLDDPGHAGELETEGQGSQ